MDQETLNVLLNSVNSALMSPDGPTEGFITIGKHTVSRSMLVTLKEGLESKLEGESGD